MINIISNNKFIRHNDMIYEFINVDRIDKNFVRINLKPLSYDFTNYKQMDLFMGHAKINGVIKKTSQEIIESL